MPLDAETRPEVLHSTCPHDCPSTCALEVERLSPTQIGRVRGAKSNDYTSGVVCAKVGRYAERVHHPDRLSTPLRRVGEKGMGIEAFEPISWDDALDEVSERLLGVEQRHGAEAVWPYFYAGTMGLVQRDGIERLRHVKRYSRQASTICVTLADTGWKAGTGIKRGVDAREIKHSDLVVVWGCNPVHTQVNIMTHISRARKTRGAKFAVVDPYRTGTADQADIHLAVRPGTDGALAAAMVHQILKEGLADRDYLRDFTDWDDELEAHFESCSPEWAAAITGLDEAAIIDFARLYGSTKRSFIRAGHGFSRSRNGAASMHAVSCLPAVTGAWRYEGGGAFYGQVELFRLDKSLIEGLDVKDRSVRILDQSRIGPILEGDKRDLGDGPPIHALFIQNTNPVSVCPDSGAVARGFARDDLFVCVHEQFMTETAAMADIVLPATTFLEHDDVYIASGHTFLQVTRKIIEPYAESRSNHDVLRGLARRLGASHPGFEMTEWEIIDHLLKASGLPDAETVHANHWHDCAGTFEDMHFLNGFETKDRRFHFKPDWSRFGRDHAVMPALPGYFDVIDHANEEHPFRLVTAPARSYLNSTFTETPGSRAREERPRVKIHPRTARELGIEEGMPVRLGNRQGTVVVEAELFDGLQPHVLVVESIWPNAAFAEGRGINHLVSADPGPPMGGAVFHDTAVWARKA
jgi:anaerobic selenocysteine-containing dehydrogenase